RNRPLPLSMLPRSAVERLRGAGVIATRDRLFDAKGVRYDRFVMLEDGPSSAASRHLLPASGEKANDLVVAPRPASGEKDNRLVVAPRPASGEKDNDLAVAPRPASGEKDNDLVVAPRPASGETDNRLVVAPRPAKRGEGGRRPG